MKDIICNMDSHEIMVFVVWVIGSAFVGFLAGIVFSWIRGASRRRSESASANALSSMDLEAISAAVIDKRVTFPPTVRKFVGKVRKEVSKALDDDNAATSLCENLFTIEHGRAPNFDRDDF